MSTTILDFEQPFYDLKQKVEELESFSGTGGIDLSEEVAEMLRRGEAMQAAVFSQLEPYQVVQLARHPERPQTSDYIEMICDEFLELHGDRAVGDDRAIVCGLAIIDGRRCLIVGHRAGKGTRESVECNFGMPRPEGYRKALAKMRLAEKLGLPIITFINTKGADCTPEAEERGQAWLIAENLREMAGLRVPTINIVIGEGGSGGALGIAMGDRVFMLQYAYYSVITPEGCSAILFKSPDRWQEAAAALRLTSSDLSAFGLIDEVIPEPVGGAQRNRKVIADGVKRAIVRAMDELGELSADDLLDRRYAKYRSISFYEESARQLYEELDLGAVHPPREVPPAPESPLPGRR